LGNTLGTSGEKKRGAMNTLMPRGNQEERKKKKSRVRGIALRGKKGGPGDDGLAKKTQGKNRGKKKGDLKGGAKGTWMERGGPLATLFRGKGG